MRPSDAGTGGGVGTAPPGAPAAGRLPPWLRVRVHCGGGRRHVAHLVEDLRLNTVCSGARCPNLAECWHRGTATFMILGPHCTRSCAFCAVGGDVPAAVEADEPGRIAEACVRLKLRFAVITSVTRDDLPDLGAGQFARVIATVRRRAPETGIEVLTPDFQGREDLIAGVLGAAPTVFNHNIETCRRLTPAIRAGAGYDRSLAVLAAAARGADGVAVKSGLMVGLGETDEEVLAVLRDLRRVGVDIVTIGQYLPPPDCHWPVARYVRPAVFARWAAAAEKMGFRGVASAPLVRSSYRARELAQAAGADRD